MRPLGQRLRRQPPHAGKGGIGQPQAAVAGEHRDAFGKIVERFALDADQLFEPPIEIEAFGHVVEQISDAAIGIGRGDDPQCPSVGQMPGVFLGLHGAISRLQLRLPLPEISFLGQFARGPQFLKHRRVGRTLIEKSGIEIPQRAIGGIIKCELLIGAEHGDAG